MTPETYLHTLPDPFTVPQTLDEFRVRYPRLRDDSHRFWALYFAMVPAALEHAGVVRAIIHRLVFANLVSMGGAIDELRARKLDAILDHLLEHPECRAALTCMQRCWLESALWREVDYGSVAVADAPL